MGFFSGFSGEFGKQLASSRAEEADRAERQSAMESSILQHLSTSPDPEIASHAITGLLDLAGPQKKAGGFGGWLGKMQAHPALPTIRQLISQGRQVEDQGPQAPRQNVEEGVRSLPGTPTASLGHELPEPAPSGPRTLGPPSPDQAEPVAPAATPPPTAPFASGYKPATTRTVPRHVLPVPGELEAEQAGLKETAVLHARGQAYDAFAGTPGKQSLIPGVNNPPAPHALGEWQDEKGEVGPAGQWYKQELVTDSAGVRSITRTPISKVPPRPTGPEASTLEGAKQLQAAALAAGRPMSDDEAIAAYRVQQRAQTLTTEAEKHTAALDAHRNAMNTYVRGQQAINGTVPMTRAQAIAGATQILPKGPETTPGAIGAMADALQALDGGKRGAVVSPIRADLSKPLGATPPPAPPAAPGVAGVAGAVQGAAPDLANLPVHPDKTAQTPAQIQTQQRQATKVLSHLGQIQQDIETIDQMGLMGPIGGRWGAFLAGTVGTVGDGYTPEQARALGKFRTDMGLLKSGMAMVHGGARGGGSVQMMQRMDALISADKMDKNLLLGATDAFKGWLEEYAKPSTVGPAGGPPAAPPAAGAIPPAVKAALKGAPAGKHTLSDGSVWTTDAAGNITKGG